MSSSLPHVPNAPSDAEVDPSVADALREGPLPTYYLPAAMPQQVSGWRRLAAWTVVVMLISSASAGLCLTYGPEELWRFLGFWGS